MPKYLYQVSYTAEGAKGLLKEGGSKRKAAAEGLVKSLGGKLEAFYFMIQGGAALLETKGIAGDSAQRITTTARGTRTSAAAAPR